MKLKSLALFLVIALMVTMLSSCEVLKFANHMLNIFGPEDENDVNLDLDIVLPGGSGNGEHVHNWVTIPGKPSTCKTNGYTDKVVCSECDEVRVASTKIDLAPHTYDDSYDRTCNICGYTRDCDHTMTEIIPGYPATEVAEGLIDGTKCKFCDAIIVPQQTIPTINTAGLTFKWDRSQNGYIVTGIEQSDCSVIYINKSHNNHPIVSISSSAFSGCTSLISVVIPDSVTSIGYGAFSLNHALKSVVIPNSVEIIDSSAFLNCSELKSVTIGNGVKTIGTHAFAYCDELTSIKFEGTVSQWNAIAKDETWDEGINNYTITCTDGTVSK